MAVLVQRFDSTLHIHSFRLKRLILIGTLCLLVLSAFADDTGGFLVTKPKFR